MNAFKDANIDYIKGPPSLTHVHQASDVASTFRDLKSGLTKATKDCKCVGNPTLEGKIDECIRQLLKECPSIKLSSNFEHKIKNALLKIISVMKSGNITPDKIIERFVRTRQHVLEAIPGTDSTINYDKIMSKSLCDVTTEHEEYMKAKVNEIGEEFLLHGGVSNEYLDSMGIVSDFYGAPNRDGFSISRQDCVIITHADTIDSYKEYQRKNSSAAAEARKGKARKTVV